MDEKTLAALEKEISKVKKDNAKSKTISQEVYITQNEFKDAEIIATFEDSIIFKSGNSFYCIEKRMPFAFSEKGIPTTTITMLGANYSVLEEVSNPEYKTKKSTNKKVAPNHKQIKGGKDGN